MSLISRVSGLTTAVTSQQFSHRIGFVALLSVAVLVVSVGCSGEDAQVSELRQKLVLDAEPANATTIAAAKNGIEENDRVSIVAQVSADDVDAFVEGQAAFLVTELGHDGEGHCGDDECQFCDHGPKGPNAAVKFVGEEGHPLAVDARDLFGIREGDVVVVQGKGRVMPGVDMLQITAEHIYVRTQSESVD